MSVKRSGALAMSALVLVLIVGAVQASAQSAPTVLKFYDSGGQTTGVGFDLNNPNAIPPVGCERTSTPSTLENIGSRSSESRLVRRSAMCSCECTVLRRRTCHGRSSTASAAGSLTFPTGSSPLAETGAFSNGHVSYYDITGGVGPYANDRGQIKVVNSGQRRLERRRSRSTPEASPAWRLVPLGRGARTTKPGRVAAHRSACGAPHLRRARSDRRCAPTSPGDVVGDHDRCTPS